MQYGPNDEINLGVGDTRGLFTTGRCALTMDWGDIGTLALDPETYVQDKVGATITPGWKEILDRATGNLVPCDATTCPKAIDGVNYAPFASFGGWSGAINAAADQKKKDAAFAFLAYMSAPAQSGEDVTLGKTGFNPYRTSHFTDRAPWTAVGMSQAAAGQLPRRDQGQPRTTRTWSSTCGSRRPRNTSRSCWTPLSPSILPVSSSVEETMQQITDGWNQITDQVGRDAQLKAYQDSLGVKR